MAGGKNLWRNNNLSTIPYASNWDSISTNWTIFPDTLPVANAVITALAASTTPANRLYVGTSAQRLYKIDNANVGTPAMVNITSTTTAALFPNANIASIAVDPNNADNIMVAFSNYGVYSLFYSSNAGSTWTKVGGNLEQNASGTGDGPSCRWVSIIPVSNGYVYLVGTSVGLFATTQLNGLNTVWVQQGTNTIGSDVVDMLDYRATDGLVVVATHSGGIYASHITDTLDVAGVLPLAQNQIDLGLQVYPNPFSYTTNVLFNLPQAMQVNLTVYNQLGQQVLTLENTILPQGNHSIPLQGKGLTPGMYFINLQTQSFKATKQVLFLK